MGSEATWPIVRRGPIPKDPKGTAKKKRAKRARGRRTKERDHKTTVRIRDRRRCRFPLCGCRSYGLRLEVSHDRHKGAGGNPKGDRSTPAGMILLCWVRHQTGKVSRHAGTLQLRDLTRRRKNGPVAFLVDVETLEAIAGRPCVEARRAANAGTGYVELARERDVQELEPLADWQRRALEALAEETYP